MLPKTAFVLAVPTATDTPADAFYDRLQRIWDQVLVLEDMGIVHNEADKFRYAYQLAEAEIQALCMQTASAH